MLCILVEMPDLAGRSTVDIEETARFSLAEGMQSRLLAPDGFPFAAEFRLSHLSGNIARHQRRPIGRGSPHGFLARDWHSIPYPESLVLL
jgi:hypothetical protein